MTNYIFEARNFDLQKLNATKFLDYIVASQAVYHDRWYCQKFMIGNFLVLLCINMYYILSMCRISLLLLEIEGKTSGRVLTYPMAACDITG